MSEKQSTNRLAAAAEALIEAASLEADAMTKKALIQSLDSLKASFDGNLNKVVQTVKSSDENFDAKINTLTQHVKNFDAKINTLTHHVENLDAKINSTEATKMKVLETALSLSLTDVHSFLYYDYGRQAQSGEYGRQAQSGELAKRAIKYFMLGYGMNLPSGYSLDGYGDRDGLAFREKFKQQIKALIRREPRLEKNNDGNFTIYYS
jgi:archaellum component FlaC